ncbi:MAG: hypothetical protein HOD92_01720 [Deltaproteobacteria bacterium]|jgi:hypothetical protein|nr:hypothetical protein [Deltaproteobacteria bacterium]
MKTIDLLIIKTGEQYIRFKNNAYFPCQLDKATVFPMEQLETVKNHLRKLENGNFKQVSVRKLILSEEAFDIEPTGDKIK